MGEFISLPPQALVKLQHRFYELFSFYDSKFGCYELNKDYNMPAFLSLSETMDLFCILNKDFLPFLMYATYVHVGFCTLSTSGNYAAFQTASAHRTNDDADCLFFMDVKNKEIKWQTKNVPHCKYTRQIFINEYKNIVELICDDIIYRFSYDGELLVGRHFENDYIHSKTTSPSQLLNECSNILDELKDSHNEELFGRIDMRLAVIETNPKISTYKLSRFYKNYGCYFASIAENQQALYYLKKGLAINPKLSVDKLIDNLEQIV